MRASLSDASSIVQYEVVVIYSQVYGWGQISIRRQSFDLVSNTF